MFAVRNSFAISISLLLVYVVCLANESEATARDPHAGHKHKKFGTVVGRSRGFRPTSKPTPHVDSVKVDEMVQIFKRNVLRLRNHTQLDLIFVIDASKSVELHNFKDEIRFVSRFVSGIPVSMDTTRVAVITFANSEKMWVDQVSADNIHDHKCSLLGTSLPAITYASGSTYTYGGLLMAKNIVQNARPNSKRVVLLITDGKSNGGDPRDVAQRLKREGVEIFTFGVHSGNVEELRDMASVKKEDHVYILESFAEFEAVARRALHADAEGGDFIAENDMHCHKFCSNGSCCHPLGDCRCGTTTGKYECVCGAGYYGIGLKPSGCEPCPKATYKIHPIPGGVETCTPCPDPNMSSPSGSTELSDCSCKTGYSKVENSCEIMRCVKLQEPANGKFLGASCDNSYQTRCQVTCDKGYDLVGSENMTCGLSGLWETDRGFPIQWYSCQVRHCDPLNVPLQAIMNCTTADWRYRTVCETECNTGYFLMGSKIRECNANQEWNGETTNCQEIRCPYPKVPSRVQISSNCKTENSTGRTLSYNETCTLQCSAGFRLSVASLSTCFDGGKWTVDSSNARCVDVEPPTLNCPTDVEVIANPRLLTTVANWSVPMAHDNSGQVTLSSLPALKAPVSFHIGYHVVTYIAEDQRGLKAQCNFTVSVIDAEPPGLVKCENPEPFVIAREENQTSVVEWEEPQFVDNSGSINVSRSREFGILPLGQTKVIYVATDPTGNSRTCVLTINVQHNNCPPLIEPKYGHKSCRLRTVRATNAQVVDCELLCDSKRYGMAMQEYGNPYHTCVEDGHWEPPQTIPKDCSHQRYSSEILKGFRVSYSMATQHNCNDTRFLESVKQVFISKLTPRIPVWCRTATTGIRCTLVSVDVTCVSELLPTDPPPTTEDPYGYGDEDPYGYKDYPTDYFEEEEEKRKKRDLTRTKFRKLLTNHRVRRDNDPGHFREPTPGSDYPEDRSAPSDFSFMASLDIPDDMIERLLAQDGPMKHYLEVTINIRGEITLNDSDTTESRHKHGQMSEYFGQLDLAREFTGQLQSVTIRHLDTSAVEYITYDQDSYTASAETLLCPIGSVLRSQASCVNCPIGTYYNIGTADCASCSVGSYQDREAQLTCHVCPRHMSTSAINSISLEACKDLCKPGTYSSNGLETCMSCRVHSYNSRFGATECEPCPAGTGTNIQGASSVDQCGELCKPGFVSRSGNTPCVPCPANTFQFNSGLQSCFNCPTGLKTTGKNSTTIKDCKGSFTTLGLARDQITDSDTSQLSSLSYSECFKDPCLHNSNCSTDGASYHCTCTPGYTGINCGIDIDECANGPCMNGGSCIDNINHYKCICLPGFTGLRCETDINECEPVPCRNNATCTDLLAKFHCDCIQGYAGNLCEVDINECDPNLCQNFGTCHDLIGKFECTCAPGFTGIHCGVNINDCASNPCSNGGTCEDGIDSFTCHCATGFAGTTCSKNIDDCAQQPCSNGATCQDLVADFHCVCPPTFNGKNCETKLYPDFDLSFSRPNTYQHVHLMEGIGNMTETTVAFFMQSNNNETEGTPFSYAIGNGRLADIFTLTNLEALTLYVNGEAVVTDARKLNDGQWYHLVVTWSSEGGEWKIYVNRVLEASGSGLEAGSRIQGGGIMVIGQEQDCLGGCFSSSQEFIGKITQFNWYNYAMTPSQVSELFLNCVGIQGNVKAWPDTLSGIKGDVVILRPQTFCQACFELIENNNLQIRKQNNYTNWLSCENGFNLRVRVGSNSRHIRGSALLKCGNMGLWRYRGIDRKNPSQLFFCQRRECPPFQQIAYGQAIGNGHMFNDTVSYVCNVGYNRIGSGSIRCLADETWSSAAPLCHDIDECANNPCHSRAVCKNNDGSYTCKCVFGFAGNGVECTEINCGSPGVLQHGEITGMNFKLNGVVHFSCITGYVLEGPNQRTCLSTSEWSDTGPHCNIIECDDPEQIDNGVAKYSSKTYQSEMKYSCNVGHEMRGDSSRMCREDRTWSGEPPFCIPIKCADPPNVLNSIVVRTRVRQYQYLDKIKYMCEAGYRLVGDAAMQCSEHGNWSGIAPECTPMSCGRPMDINNGKFTGKSFVYRNTVTYSCNAGYDLVGDSVIACLETGLWSENKPFCDPVSCRKPSIVEHSTSSSTGERYKDTVTYTCNSGYYLIGNSELECLARGVWGNIDSVNDVSIICLPKPCGRPDDISHAIYQLIGEEDFVYGSSIRFTCGNGYLPKGDNLLVCQTNQTWNTTEDFFSCDPVPCPLSPLKNGKIDGVDTEGDKLQYTYMDSILFTCNEGFVNTGANYSTCLASGLWSEPTPICDPVQCSTPPLVANASTDLESGPHKPGLHYQSKLHYSCDTGFKLSNSSHHTIMCNSDASWTGETPVCERVYCGILPNITHASIVGGGDKAMLFGDVVIMSCDEGFQTNDSLDVTCTSNATFSFFPKCLPIPCGPPSSVQYSSSTYDHPYMEHSFLSTVTYNCEQDFEMHGQNVITCLRSGKWSHDLPICVPIRCNKPGKLKNGFTTISTLRDVQHSNLYDDNHFAPRSAAISVCNNGYMLKKVAPSLTRSSNLQKLNMNTANLHLDLLTDEQKAKLNKAMLKYSSSTTDKNLKSQLKSTNLHNAPSLAYQTCSQAGSWVRSAPECNKMKCHIPPDVDHGRIIESTSDQYTFASTITYRCDIGHYFVQNSINQTSGRQTNGTITCVWNELVSDVRWSSDPMCLPVKCPTPTDNNKDHKGVTKNDDTSDQYVYGDTVVYICDQGYETSDVTSIQCGSNWEWEHDPPICNKINCPSLPQLINGVTVGENVEFGSNVTFSCNVGHYMIGNDTTTCQWNKKWSSLVPSCEPVNCGEPPDVINGITALGSFVYNGTTKYTCYEGFVLQGSSLLVCDEFAYWFPEPPTCVRIHCPVPLLDEHTYYKLIHVPEFNLLVNLSEQEIQRQTFVYETTIMFICERGYEQIDGSINETSECLSDGTWSEDTPFCYEVDCGSPPLPDPNGSMLGKGHYYGDEVMYSCNLGYFTLGVFVTVTCTEHGNWSLLSIPPCLPVDCGKPENPQMGNHVGNKYTFPSYVNYTCNVGYYLLGADRVYCEPDGLWSNVVPDCYPVDCGLLPQVQNAILNITSTTYKSKANYSCLPGYYLDGFSGFTCLSNGIWDGVPPSCLPVDCGPVGVIDNGFILGGDNLFKSVVHFVCEKGFDLIGPNNTTCLEDAIWSNFPPDCFPKDCGTPPVVENSHLLWNGKNSTYTTRVPYKCHAGYEPFNKDLTFVVCQHHGNWSEKPVCKKVRCFDPVIPEHGAIEMERPPYFQFGDKVKFACERGYPPSGPTTSTCNENGTWSNPSPRCKIVDCGRLPNIVNGFKTGNSTTFMSAVTYHCDEGYQSEGQTTLECLYTGSWNGEIPVCSPISCGKPPKLRSGEYTESSYLFKSVVFYDCNAGFYLTGPQTAKCSFDKTWKFESSNNNVNRTIFNRPICVKQTCPNPPLIENGVLRSNIHVYGDEVEYGCNDGYELVNTEPLTCSGNHSKLQGFYVGKPAICEPVSCGIPQTISNGFYVSNGTTYLSTANYHCNSGYFTEDNSQILCQTTQSWTPTPFCQPHDCGIPPNVTNSYINITSTLYLAKLKYKCNERYYMKGSGNINCLEDGTWSSNLTSCHKISCGDSPNLEYSDKDNNGHLFGDSVTYKCKKGFEMLPPNTHITTTCQSNKHWDMPNVECVPVSCGVIPTVLNGETLVRNAEWHIENVKNKVFYMDKVDITCNNGYSIDGNHTITCESDGVFDNLFPTCPPKNCGLPKLVQNAQLSYSGITFNNSVEIACNSGYTMRSGHDEIKSKLSMCGVNGKWEDYPSNLSCERISCAQPPIIKKGRRLTSVSVDYKYGDIVNYTCNKGHELRDNADTMICKADKTWTSPPVCIPVNCGPPLKCPLNATCDTTATTYLHTSEVTCNPGFQLGSNLTSFKMVCNERGIWDSPVLRRRSLIDFSSCHPQSCGDPPTIIHGSSKSNNIFQDQYLNSYGDTVSYKCDLGYQLAHTNHLKCQADKTWGPSPPPQCKPLDCGPLNCPVNANCTMVSTIYDPTITHNAVVQCHLGNEIVYDVTKLYTKCKKDGMWSNANTSCLPVKCAKPENIENGKIVESDLKEEYEYMNKVRYLCDSGYDMAGPPTLTCTETHFYDSKPPVCSPVFCGDPINIVNGEVEKTGTTFANNASYSCNAGYILKGEELWKCSHDAVWKPYLFESKTEENRKKREITEGLAHSEGSGSGSGPPETFISSFSLFLKAQDISSAPTCEPILCGEAPILEHGMHVNGKSTFVFGEKVQYICDDGFKLEGPGFLTCMEDGNYGLDLDPHCGRVSCTEPPIMNNSYISSPNINGYVFNDTVSYACKTGFEYKSTSPKNTIQCSSDTHWLPETPEICLPISCGQPPIPIHSKLDNYDITFNSTVAFKCLPGYELNGPPTKTCLSNREWLPKYETTCDPVFCGHPINILNGHYTGQNSFDLSNFVYQKTVTYSCNDGYEFSIEAGENEILTCLENRKWDHSPPICNPVNCSTPPSVKNGRFTGSDYHYGSTVSYICDVGHEINGRSLLSCLADKNWSEQVPSCNPVTCDKPPFVENSHYKTSDSLSYRNSVIYTCNKGYHMLGSNTLTCTSNKTYDLAPPTCLPNDCHQPTRPQHGTVVSSSGATTFGHNFTFGCDVGYHMQSDQKLFQITCTGDGTWSAPSPTCAPVNCGKPPSISHGVAHFTSTTFSAVSVYSCDSGYELGGNFTQTVDICPQGGSCLMCNANKQWGAGLDSNSQPVVPICEKITCKEPPSVQNGRFVANSFLFEDRAEYSCENGFHISDPDNSEMICQGDKTWGPNVTPTCERNLCPLPYRLENGFYNSTKLDYVFGDKISYFCDKGFRFVKVSEENNRRRLSESFQKKEVTCLADQTWSNINSTCKRVVCSFVPTRVGGYTVFPIEKVHVYGDNVTYYCNRGYEATLGKKEETITCQHNGQWSTSYLSPCTKVKCKVPQNVNNSIVNANYGSQDEFKKYRERIYYKCKEGFEMKGNDFVRCQYNHEWSQPTPECHPVTCGLLPTLLHATRVVSNRDKRSVVEPLPPDIVNLKNQIPERKQSQRNVFGDNIKFKCDSGYEFEVSEIDYLRCGPNQNWSLPYPVCIPVTCEPPPEVSNGQRSGNEFTFEKNVTYTCNEGYHSTDATKFICHADRLFRSQDGSTLAPACDKVSCGRAPQVTNGGGFGNMSSEYFYQDQISYSCKSGFEMNGQSVVTCQSNQKYSLLPTCIPLDCGVPPTSPHSSVNYIMTLFGNTATYTCDIGYVGQIEAITCNKDALWSERSAVCKKVDCGTPTEVAFGVVDINGTTYGDEAVYSCYAGYFMAGATKLQCEATGLWSSPCPLCKPVPCTPPSDLVHGGYILQGNYSFGGIMQFFCDDGYRLVGDSISLCTSLGNWSTLMPTCDRISCGAIPNVVNSEPLSGTMFFGDIITYRCKFGHVLVGPPSIECGSNGKLENLPPTCFPISCPNIPNITNARPSQDESYHFGDLITFECLPSYQLQGSPIKLLCDSDGTFKVNVLAEQGVCLPVECPNLPNIEHGSLSQPGGRFGDRVSISCENGYTLKAPGSITCTANATWSNKAPRCHPVVCGSPPNIANAKPIGSHIRTFGSGRVAYKCDEGHALKDPNINTLTCLHNGDFSENRISCLPVHCKEMAPVKHGKLIIGGTVFGAKASFKCDKGFEMNTYDDVINFKCLPTGEWSPDFKNIFCDPILCDSLAKPENGNIQIIIPAISSLLDQSFLEEHQDPYYDMHYGAKVRYVCDTGYELKGEAERTCAADRSWSSAPPTCVPVNCGRAPLVANSTVPDTNYTYGMTAFYECNIGFMLSGSESSHTCQSNKQFSEENISCIPVSCNNIPFVAHGSPSVTHAIFGDTVSYTCNKGYEIVENEEIKCGALSYFSSPTPVCKRVKCPPLTSIQDATYNMDGISYGDRAVLSCEMGYKLNSNESVINLTCQADQAWSHNLIGVTCDLNPCEKISEIENGYITVVPPLNNPDVLNGDFESDHIYNTRLTFTCNSGYILMGEEVIHCNGDGLWDHPPPKCEARECLNPPTVENAILISDRHVFGGHAQYECIDGYKLTTLADSHTCNADGSFSNYDVHCSLIVCSEIPRVKNGKVLLNRNRTRGLFGDKGITNCNFGYEKHVGSTEFICLSSGQWSKSDDTCLPVPCGFAPTVKNASPTTDKNYTYVFGDTAHYNCNLGYIPGRKAKDNLKCDENGIFQDVEDIVCNPVPCPQLNPVKNGVIEGNGWLFGSKITVTCNDGYYFKPGHIKQISMYCQDNGVWSHDPTQVLCEGIQCNSLEIPTHGNIDLSFAETVENSEALDADSVVFPSTVVYQCNPGYILVGRSKRKCLEDGGWSGQTPYCQPVDCGRLPRILYGTIQGNQITTVGNTATYKCDKGYKLEPRESTNRQCLETGFWSGVHPICTEITCDVQPVLEHGFLSSNTSVLYGNTIHISCDTGYILHGDTERTCGLNGTFTGEPPVCTPVSCGVHPAVGNAILSSDQEIRFKESILINCDHGFHMLGDGQRTCQNDGTWSGTSPICVGLRQTFDSDPIFDEPVFDNFALPLESVVSTCSKPKIGSHVKLLSGNRLLSTYDEASELEFCCRNGYLPLNVMTTRCEHGNWTDIPICLPACKKRCLNNGKCSSRGKCSCVHGWAGSRCNRPICALRCLNGGYCSAPFTCACANGWTGSRCQTAICDVECKNGGVCVGPNMCNCPYGFTKDDCSMKSFFNFW